jgi:hypothetical protein
MTFRKALAKSPTLPASRGAVNFPIALILDSTPGDHGMSSAIASMAPSNPVARLVAVPVVAALYSLFYFVNAARGNSPIYTEMRMALQQVELLPNVSDKDADAKAAPRLYFYSPRDRMTLFADVERHIAEARHLGFDVDVEKYDDTSHVGHMRADPDRYWQAVSRVWAKSVKFTAKL